MGSLVTRHGLHRHPHRPRHIGSWRPGAPPPADRVIAPGYTAVLQSRGGLAAMPVSQPAATFSADGAPFYNSGYLPGYPSAWVGSAGLAELRLPPLAAQVDLLDMQSWDRPVTWCGVA